MLISFSFANAPCVISFGVKNTALFSSASLAISVEKLINVFQRIKSKPINLDVSNCPFSLVIIFPSKPPDTANADPIALSRVVLSVLETSATCLRLN